MAKMVKKLSRQKWDTLFFWHKNYHSKRWCTSNPFCLAWLHIPWKWSCLSLMLSTITNEKNPSSIVFLNFVTNALRYFSSKASSQLFCNQRSIFNSLMLFMFIIILVWQRILSRVLINLMTWWLLISVGFEMVIGNREPRNPFLAKSAWLFFVQGTLQIFKIP